MSILGLVLTLAVAAPPATPPPAPPPPNPAELLAASSHVFAYSPEGLSGPGGDFLRDATAGAQFVLFGEEHLDHEVPRFASGLYAMLHAAHDFHTVVLEQDGIAIEDALAPERRGDVERLARHAKRYNTLYEFDTDEDLAFVALAARLEPGPDAVWGIEQATGATRYLEELAGLAPDAHAKALVQACLEAAHAADDGPKYTVVWLADLATPARLAELARAFGPTPDPRAARLLEALAKSAEIFGYYTRATQGEFVGLYNNTVRETWMKQQFLRRYQAASQAGAPRKAFFKLGANHVIHGKNATQAFPTGNLAHELAIANGSEAYGLFVIPYGPGYVDYAKDLPAFLKPLLPATAPTVPTLVDLRPLRRFQKLFREQLEPALRPSLLEILHGFDALVLLPNSRPAVRQLGGRAPG